MMKFNFTKARINDGRYHPYKQFYTFITNIDFYKDHALSGIALPFFHRIKEVFSCYTQVLYLYTQFYTEKYDKIISEQTQKKGFLMLKTFKLVFNDVLYQLKEYLMSNTDFIDAKENQVPLQTKFVDFVRSKVDELNQQMFQRGELISYWIALIFFEEQSLQTGYYWIRYDFHEVSFDLQIVWKQVLIKSLRNMQSMYDNYVYLRKKITKQSHWTIFQLVEQDAKKAVIETAEQRHGAEMKIQDYIQEIQSSEVTFNIFQSIKILLRLMSRRWFNSYDSQYADKQRRNETITQILKVQNIASQLNRRSMNLTSSCKILNEKLQS